VREFRALVSAGAEYCIVPKVDAYALGYQEAANDDPVTPAENTITSVTYDGYGKMALISIARVDLGSISFDRVEFVAFDLPAATGLDVVLGRSLLRFTRFQLDYASGELRIEDAR